VGLRGISYENVNLIELAQDPVQSRTFVVPPVNAVIRRNN